MSWHIFICLSTDAHMWTHTCVPDAHASVCAEITINQITDTHTDDSGKTTVAGIDFSWNGGRPCQIRMQRSVPADAAGAATAQNPEVRSIDRPSVLGVPLS